MENPISENLIHTPERELDVQKLCRVVLNTSSNFWDNPNGAYESTCPFCYAQEHRGWNDGKNHAEMSELSHLPDCAYLIAKDLSTNC